MEVREVRATGGATRSPLWRQILADVLDTPVRFPDGHDGSAYGAALVGMRTIGTIERFEDATSGIAGGEVVTPDPGAAAIYAALRPLHAQAYVALRPVLRDLRGLADRFWAAGERQRLNQR